MEWNLLPILNCDGKRMPIDVSLELEAGDADDFRILGEVALKGEIVNVGGSLELTAQGLAKLEQTCDRCTERFTTELVFPLKERMKKVDALDGEQEDPDLLLIEGGSIDLAELVYSSLYLNLPSKALCSENCKGLCPVCGKNLNLGECSCDDRPTDPRFDILDQLL
ncbi:MAG: DUF177 domain-containing protein [Clostridia bacterium]|nr:DUF177 domain-containing protein [Clostridia bacterium]